MIETNADDLFNKTGDVTIKIMSEVWYAYKWGEFVYAF
jgi:hypothetical protein